MEDPLVQGTNGIANGTPPSSAPPPAVDPEELIRYLSSVLEVTLGAAREDLEQSGSLLHESVIEETLARCTRFALESQVALYVLKQAALSQQNGQTNGDGPHMNEVYTLSSEVAYSSRTIGCVAFLKRPTPLSSALPISRQVSVVNLPLGGGLGTADSNASSSPYEILHSLVRGALTPLFEATAKGSESANERSRLDGESRTGVSGARRKLADLEVSLQNLQQNIEVEGPRLQIHDAVRKQLAESHGDWQEAALRIPDDLVLDGQFLNRLQNMANEWIKQIRDFSSSSEDRPVLTTTQEKNFWLAMETAMRALSCSWRVEACSSP
jgi:dynein heavy chain 1